MARRGLGVMAGRARQHERVMAGACSNTASDRSHGPHPRRAPLPPSSLRTSPCRDRARRAPAREALSSSSRCAVRGRRRSSRRSRRAAPSKTDAAGGRRALEVAFRLAQARRRLGVADAGFVRGALVREDQRRHEVSPRSCHVAVSSGRSIRKTAPPRALRPRRLRRRGRARDLAHEGVAEARSRCSRVEEGRKICSRRSAGTPGPRSRTSSQYEEASERVQAPKARLRRTGPLREAGGPAGGAKPLPRLNFENWKRARAPR